MTTTQILDTATIESFYPLIGLMVLIMLIGVCAKMMNKVSDNL